MVHPGKATRLDFPVIGKCTGMAAEKASCVVSKPCRLPHLSCCAAAAGAGIRLWQVRPAGTAGTSRGVHAVLHGGSTRLLPVLRPSHEHQPGASDPAQTGAPPLPTPAQHARPQPAVGGVRDVGERPGRPPGHRAHVTGGVDRTGGAAQAASGWQRGRATCQRWRSCCTCLSLVRINLPLAAGCSGFLCRRLAAWMPGTACPSGWWGWATTALPPLCGALRRRSGPTWRWGSPGERAR